MEIEIGKLAEEVVALLAWPAPLAFWGFCFWAWPKLCRRRGFTVTAAILCFTPAFAYYGAMDHIVFWPLALCIPSLIMVFPVPGGLKYITFAILPFVIMIGLCAWFLWGIVQQDTKTNRAMGYLALWPLALCVPFYVMMCSLPRSLIFFSYMSVPIVTIYGLCGWFLWRFMKQGVEAK